MSGEVMTVAGPVPAGALGAVLPHEHLIANANAQWIYPDDPAMLEEYTRSYDATLHGRVQLEPFSYRSAMQQLDFDVAREELDLFAAAGGGGRSSTWGSPGSVATRSPSRRSRR